MVDGLNQGTAGEGLGDDLGRTTDVVTATAVNLRPSQPVGRIRRRGAVQPVDRRTGGNSGRRRPEETGGDE
ncbi:MAG: hypothetical protein IIC08_07410 [Proteobacteria bacterium]|nr:hypothetical protein [Pseudomonadota bacterium]